jgi:ABC-type Fe3+-siderophore transport system permease subunit
MCRDAKYVSCEEAEAACYDCKKVEWEVDGVIALILCTLCLGFVSFCIASTWSENIGNGIFSAIITILIGVGVSIVGSGLVGFIV